MDAVRLMRRLLRQAAALPGAPAMRWHDRRRMAKRCASAIAYSRGKDNRRRLYRKLIAATHATRAALLRAAKRLTGLAGIAAERWRAQVDHYLPLIARVLAQSAFPTSSRPTTSAVGARTLRGPLTFRIRLQNLGFTAYRRAATRGT